MAHENDEDGLIRRYLLARLEEGELQKAEERIMADTEFFNRVLLAEDEMVEKYVQGDLTQRDRADFEDSFLSTPEGRRKVSFAKELHSRAKVSPVADSSEKPLAKVVVAEDAPSDDSGKQKPVSKERQRLVSWWPPVVPYLRLATATVVLLALGFAIWWLVIPRGSPLKDGLTALNNAYRQQRPVEPRISGFDYAPASVTRGGSQRVDTVALNRAERILLDEVDERPSAEAHHAAGKLYFAERKFDDAGKQFEKALETEPENPQLNSDYGALLLEIGKTERSKDDSGRSLATFARSLEHLTRAIELGGTLPEPLYNRALLYEEMRLPRQAENDWRLYLEKDTDSAWSDEARRHLKTIEEQKSRTSETNETLFEEFLNAYRAGDDDRAWEVVGKCHFRAGNFITEKLIDDYLELMTKREDGQARDVLKALSYAGDLQSRKAADRFTSDLARFYEASASTNVQSLISARASVRLAQKQIGQSDLHEARETYLKAKRGFERIGDRSEARFAEYWISVCASQTDPQKGIAAFQQLAAACEGHAYKSLAVRALNGLANSHLSLNSYSKAISYSRPSLNLARQTRDSYGCGLALSHLIGAYKPLGKFDECLNWLQAFLDLASTHSLEPIQACLCYAQTAWVLSACDLNEAALAYQNAALEMALELQEVTMICTSYVHQAMIEARLKRYEAALANAGRALEIAGERSGEPAGVKMKAYALLHLGSVYRQSGNLAAAVESYNRSIDLYKEIDFPAFVYLAQKGLFATLAAFGDTRLAKQELDKTISYYETQRTRITEQSNRDSFFDLEQDVYDLAIDFEAVKRDDARAAFEYSEMSRARSLLHALRRGAQGTKGESVDLPISIAAQPTGLAAIQDRIPEGVQILQYAVLEDKIISWVITRTSFNQVRKDIALREFDKKVEECSRLTQDPRSGPALLSVNRQLYDLLIAPVEPLLDKNKQLFIVPDKILCFLPFQSLVSPTNKYLISDYELELSPSSSILIACSDLARQKKQTGEESVLSVGISRFGSRQGDDVADLPDAPKEAKSIAEFYKISEPLIEGLASKSAVIEGMTKVNVVHFASHFLRDPFSPVRSRLLLARENQSNQSGNWVNASLASSEISRLNLSTVRLAVLSACQTGVERYYRGEGASSIARAFMAAGVPLVVASLWPVDSDATAELMIRFHRFRKRDGLASIAALRQAQRSILDDQDSPHKHPYYWAAFNLIGGYAEY